MEDDPREEHNIAGDHPELVERMHAEYLAWFRDVASTRGFEPVRIELGGPRERPDRADPAGLARARRRDEGQ